MELKGSSEGMITHILIYRLFNIQWPLFSSIHICSLYIHSCTVILSVLYVYIDTFIVYVLYAYIHAQSSCMFLMYTFMHSPVMVVFKKKKVHAS